MSRALQVKNRAAAPIQITAEQLLREAKERKLEDQPRAPKQYITDREELQEYRQTKRKDFENQIRRQRHHIGTWCKYALWEATQKEFERSRSVFERALDVDYRNQTIWMKYAEMEMKNKFVNHARNVYDRAVSLLPRVDVFWYKYSFMEEMVGAIEQARQVFERWMKWEPDDMGWGAYVKFEMRQGDIMKARGVLERYIACHSTGRAYLKFAHWEEKNHQNNLARTIYERALEELPEMERSSKLLIQFARFEERCKEFDRARIIFRYALEQVPKEESEELNSEYIAFEKRHGNRTGIEDAILNKRRIQYEENIAADKYDYDAWFDYIKLEQNELNIEKTRALYDRAVASQPPINEKRYWRRYIYIWIYYAVFEELHVKDVEKTRNVYKRCLSVIPHKKFTFGKIWILAANFEVRQKDLAAARKIFGQGIGLCGKENIFKGYIELELQLGEVERCRSIYVKYLETMPHNCVAWKAFATLEANVGETARARAVYELAVSQPELEMPESLWKAYIDFEIAQATGTTAVIPEEEEEEEEDAETAETGLERVQSLFERLLEKTSHVKVWIAYGKFEVSWNSSSEGDDGEGGAVSRTTKLSPESVERARAVFDRGYNVLKEQGLKEERVLLLEAWRDMERAAAAAGAGGGVGHVAAVEGRFPRKIKMRRMATDDGSGGEVGWEEYYDYSFPDDEKALAGIKILEKAMLWKQMLVNAKGMPSSSSSTTVDDSIATSFTTDSNHSNEIEIGSSTLGKRKAASAEDIDIDDI